jgi:uncharacterized protein (DUF488 family)
MAEAVGPRIYTVGHSTRTLEELVALLRREGVQHLADVRAFPASRRFPHFNRDALVVTLPTLGVSYSHHAKLGGRRKAVPDSPNDAWRNSSFRGYADHMMTADFRIALETLVTAASGQPTAIMCSEAVPWRCHRALIADALVARGVDVAHILDANTAPHTLTRFAVVRDGQVRYPKEPAAAANAPSQGNLFSSAGSGEAPGPR